MHRSLGHSLTQALHIDSVRSDQVAGSTSAAMHHVVRIELEASVFGTFTARKYIMTDIFKNRMEIVAYAYHADPQLEVIELPVRDMRGAA